jgi:hypothetical protein
LITAFCGGIDSAAPPAMNRRRESGIDGLQQNIVAQDGLKAGHQPSPAQRPPVIPTVGVQASA